MRGGGGLDDARARLARRRADSAVGVVELRLEPGARTRGAERLSGHAAPAPVGVTRNLGGGQGAPSAIRLRKRDQRLTPQREHAARDAGLQRLQRNGAAQHAQGGLGLHRDADVRVSDERCHGRRESRVAEGGNGAQRVDAHLGVPVLEQRPQPVQRAPPVEPRTVEQGLGHAARGDRANRGFAVRQRGHEARRAAGRPQAGKRIQGAPPGADVGIVGEAHQLGQGGGGAEAPRFEQRGRHDRGGRRTRRPGRHDLEEGPRALVPTNLGDRRHRLELGRPLLRNRGGTHQLQQQRQGARVLQQPQGECRRGPHRRHAVT